MRAALFRAHLLATCLLATWLLPACLLVTAVCLPAGCQSLRFPFGNSLTRKEKEDEQLRRLSDPDSVKGPLQRLVSGEKKVKGAALSPAAGRDDYEQAERLFRDGHFAEAEKRAKQIAKKYKNSPVREDALFLIAEAQFRQKKYSWAQDSYVRLVKEYPSTRYLETRNRRLFTIARYWLADPTYVTSDQVQLTGFSTAGQRPELKITSSPVDSKNAKQKKSGFDLSRAVPIFPNVWDRTRPVFDTEGRALQALRAIWTSDPTGPLADDALMLTASYHIRQHNFQEADHFLTLLREEYPKSPHHRHAHLLGSFVKQASYQGPEYDGQILEQAARLKRGSLPLAQNDEQRRRLKEELKQIEAARAASDWSMVQFYQRKNNKRAMAVYCREILRKYPDSPYARKAREKLRELTTSATPAKTRTPATRVSPSEPKKPLRRTPAPRLFRVPKVALPRLPSFSWPRFSRPGSSDSTPSKTSKKPGEREKPESGSAVPSDSVPGRVRL